MAHPRNSPTAASPHSHTQTQTQTSRGSHKANTKTTTPMVSPRAPYSVGQSHPPLLSPANRPSDARSSSPNYFGLVVEPSDPRESHVLPRDNWSPSSSIKSFGTALPKTVSLEGNREFEAFKRQADLNRGKSFAPNTSHHQPTSNPAPVRPKPARWNTHASDNTGSDRSFPRASSTWKDRPRSKMDVDLDRTSISSLHDSAYVSSDSKRSSALSPHAGQILGMPPFASPRPMDPSEYRTTLTRAEDRDPRLSIMEHKVDPPSPRTSHINRAATLPIALEGEQPSMIAGQQLLEITQSIDHKDMLILDIRSTQNFATSRIKGALNLCIPTTLLKRASFNIQKLQQIFQKGPDSEKFSAWRDMQWIIVYDGHSSDRRDAVTAQNMIKKFTNEGYSGKTAILRGGFAIVQQSFPSLVDSKSALELDGGSKSAQASGGMAPVIGGVSLPYANNNSVNPFFSNIRQNMDLADGVGQYEVARPSGMTSPLLPRWLREAAAESDHGRRVSDKFLRIELEEQSRMRSAYAAFNPTNARPGNKVQLCGVEKGGKNRYKDILPFEHARVRLQNKAEGACDYVNASHLTASRSNKRYIASQGPLPATFEDFWSVIWEQDVRVVVMLTAESEGGQLKCHPYWKGRDFGPIQLAPLSEKKVSLDIDKYRSNSSSTPSSAAAETGRRRANTTTAFPASTPPQAQQAQAAATAPYVIIRKFALSHASQPFAPIREITHLHFPAWPDFGTPAQPSHLLALVELANVMQRAALPVETSSVTSSAGPSVDSLSINWYEEPEPESKARPMLVHCSAGCGRTGAFCTVDSVIDMLKRQRHATHDVLKTQDSEGDVQMGDYDDAVSPTTKTEQKFQFSPVPQVTPRKRKSQESVDMDISWVHDDTMDLIQKTVEEFREQRLSMVQSLRQYVLCYETVLEWVSRTNERANSTMASGRARSGSLQQARRHS